MNAKEYFEEMRKLGFTKDITSNNEPDYRQPFFQNIFRLMEGFAHERKITPVTEFEDVVRPVMKYLCENHHRFVMVIVTRINAQLLEAQKLTGQILDYVVDYPGR
jgi:hypothetical protein